MHHMGGRVPALGSPRSAVTVHDLQPLHFPDGILRGEAAFPCLFASAIGAQGAGGGGRQRMGAAVDHRDPADSGRTHGRGLRAVRTARPGRPRDRRPRSLRSRRRCGASQRQAIRTSCIPRSRTPTRTIARFSRRSRLLRAPIGPFASCSPDAPGPSRARSPRSSSNCGSPTESCERVGSNARNSTPSSRLRERSSSRRPTKGSACP